MSDAGFVAEGKGKQEMRQMLEYLKGCLRRGEKVMGEGKKESAVSLRLHRVQDRMLAFLIHVSCVLRPVFRSPLSCTRPSVFRFCSSEWNADFYVDRMGAPLGWCVRAGGVFLRVQVNDLCVQWWWKVRPDAECKRLFVCVVQ